MMLSHIVNVLMVMMLMHDGTMRIVVLMRLAPDNISEPLRLCSAFCGSFVCAAV
jgi:hypothetical protein